MPRSCSSGSRSVSLPVSARTSHVLPWSMCPAVPTVSGIVARTATRATSSTSSSRERAAVEQQPAVADDADDRRLADAQRRRELLLERAREARQLGERQRAAADARDRLLDLAAGERREPLRARARDAVVAQHAQHRDPLRRVEVERERPLERRERELVRAQRALERVAAQPLDEVGAPDDDPGLRPAEQLVAGEVDEIGAGRERLPRRRLVRDSCRLRTPEPRSSTSGSSWRCATAASCASGGSSVKPTTRKFDWCTRRSSAVSAPIARS